MPGVAAGAESAKDLGGSYYSSEPTGSELEIAIQPGSARYVGGQMHVGGLPQSGEHAPRGGGCCLGQAGAT